MNAPPDPGEDVADSSSIFSCDGRPAGFSSSGWSCFESLGPFWMNSILFVGETARLTLYEMFFRPVCCLDKGKDVGFWICTASTIGSTTCSSMKRWMGSIFTSFSLWSWPLVRSSWCCSWCSSCFSSTSCSCSSLSSCSLSWRFSILTLTVFTLTVSLMTAWYGSVADGISDVLKWFRSEE